MKKFMKFVNKKKDGGDTTSNRPSSSMGSRRSSAASLAYPLSGIPGGYEVKDKDLGRIHRAVMTGDKVKVHQLAQKEINACDKQKRTALHLACAVGSTEIVEELLEWRPQINAKDIENKTALIKAVETNHPDCARLLLEARADATLLDRDASSCFHYVAKHGLLDLIPLICKYSREYKNIINVLNLQGESALHVAVAERRIEICRSLIESGSNVDLRRADGLTPLMVACQRGYDDITALLISHQADPAIRDKTGATAVEWARHGDHVTCVEAFREHERMRAGGGTEQGGSGSGQPSPDHHAAGEEGDDDDDDFDDDDETAEASAAAAAVGAVAAAVDESGDQLISDIRSWKDWDSETESNAVPKSKKPQILNNLSRGIIGGAEDSTNQRVSLNISPVPGLDVGLGGKGRGDAPPPESARSAATIQSINTDPWSDDDDDVPEPPKLPAGPPPIGGSKTAAATAATAATAGGGKQQDSDDDWDSDVTSSLAVNNSKPNLLKYTAPPVYLPGLGRRDSGTDSIGVPTGTGKQLPSGTGQGGNSSAVAPGTQVQLSARSAASDWDTTTAPDDDEADGRGRIYPPPPVILPATLLNKDQAQKSGVGTAATKPAELLDTEGMWDSGGDDECDVANVMPTIRYIPSKPIIGPVMYGGDQGTEESEEEEESTWEKEQREKKKVKDTNIQADKNKAADNENKQVNTSVVLGRSSQSVQGSSSNGKASGSIAAAGVREDGKKKGGVSKPVGGGGGMMGLNDSFSDSETSALDERSAGESLRAPPTSMSTDLPNVISLQERVREGQKLLDSERSARATSEHKRKAVELERDGLVVKLEELTREKFNVDHAKIELEAKLRTAQYELDGEKEKRKNSELLLQKTKEQLNKKEDQYAEVRENLQSVELSLKTEQKEKSASLTRIKQLEEEKQALYIEHGDKNIFVMNETANKEKDTTIRKLEKEIEDSKRERKELKDKHDRLVVELEDLKTSMRHKQEAVDQESNDWKLNKVKLESETDSLRSRLNDTKSDLERAREANESLERKHATELDRYRRMLEQNEKDLNESHSSGKNSSDSNTELMRKVARLEAELKVVNSNLAERSTRLNSLEAELYQRRTSNKSLSDQLQVEKENNIRLETRVEALQDKLKGSQDEIESMRRELEILRSTDGSQADKLQEIINSIRAENSKANLERASSAEQLGEKLSRANERLAASEHRNEELLEQLRAVERSKPGGPATSGDQSRRENDNMQNITLAKNVVEDKINELTLSNARLEIELKYERDKSSLLKRDSDELKQTNKRLTEDTEILRENNIQLQYQMREAEGVQTRASRQADESRTLLDTEISSRSRLGLRLVQVERENKELAAAFEEERRRTRRAVEKKKQADLRLEQELERAEQVENQALRLKSNLKSTKQRIRLDSGRHQTDSVTVGAKSRSKRADSKQVQLELERLRNNEKLLSTSVPQVGGGVDEVIRGESWISSLVGGDGVGGRELSVEEVRRLLEGRARQELNEKLREVNWYLDDQFVARDRLERIRDGNELTLRKDFEKIHRQLLNEVGKLKTDQLISGSDGRSLESHDQQRQRIRELLEEETRLRDQLSANVNGGKLSLKNDRNSNTLTDSRGDLNGNILSQELEKSIRRHMENDRSTEIFDSTSSDYLSTLKQKYLL